MSISRREFVCGAAGAAAVGLGASMSLGEKSSVAGGRRDKPLLISSANGMPAVTRAAEGIQRGEDMLDAIVAGINIVENDPTDHSVGYGGLPNEDGVVELDSCVMDGRYHKAGAVASLQRIKNPSSVAVLVMRRTDHVLLVGEGALRFARAHGFKEEELLTDEARQIWLKWKESHSDKDAWLNLEGGGTSRAPTRDIEATPLARGPSEILYTTGTITCMALVPSGDLAGCTSTSGLSYKIPGRVGDSPIIGAGLYVDNEVGACGSTGRGEANIQNCSSFLAVELMRAGRTPEEACVEVLHRVVKHTEKRLRNAQDEPNYGLTFYALRKDGLWGGATMRGDTKMSVFNGEKAELVQLKSLYSA